MHLIAQSLVSLLIMKNLTEHRKASDPRLYPPHLHSEDCYS